MAVPAGIEVIPPQIGWAGYFYDGMAFVQEKNAERSMSTWVIDRTGKKQQQKLVLKGNGLYYVNQDYPWLYSGIMRSEEIVEYTGGHSHLFTYYDADGENILQEPRACRFYQYIPSMPPN